MDNAITATLENSTNTINATLTDNDGSIAGVLNVGIPYRSWSDITDKPFEVVDSSLSTTSTNPVQNKVVTAAVNDVKADIGSLKVVNGMLCQTYKI